MIDKPNTTPTSTNARRCVVQIATTGNSIHALCNDGTLWLRLSDGRWSELDLPPGCKAAA